MSMLRFARELLRTKTIKKPGWFDAMTLYPPPQMALRGRKVPKIESPQAKMYDRVFARFPDLRLEAFDMRG